MIFNKLKNVYVLLMAAGAFVACSQEKEGWEVTVSGKVRYPLPAGEITIAALTPDGAATLKETISLEEDSTYSKTVNLTEPGYYRLTFFDRQSVDLILDRSNVKVNVDGNNPAGYINIEGSPDLNLIMKVREVMNNSLNSANAFRLNDEFGQARARGDMERVAEIQNEYMKLIDNSHDQVAALIRERGPMVAIVNLLLDEQVIDRDKYFDLYLHVAEEMKHLWPDYSITKRFVEAVDNMKLLAVGQPAPEIALPDPQGVVRKLSDFRGKYVLVDFWAEWCGPCRRENPNVVKAYNKYKDKGFTVFGVSLDRNKADWLQAIEEDGLTWTHVSDLKYFNSQAAKDYNITAIPFSVLIDPDGIIIAKNLRGKYLDQKLEEVL